MSKIWGQVPPVAFFGRCHGILEFTDYDDDDLFGAHALVSGVSPPGNWNPGPGNDRAGIPGRTILCVAKFVFPIFKQVYLRGNKEYLKIFFQDRYKSSKIPRNP